MASSLIGALRVSLGLDTAQFESGAKKASSIAKREAGTMETSFKSARTAVEGLFAAFAIGALTEQIKKSLDYAGSIAEVAKTLGVTTTQLQQFRFAASQTGVTASQLSPAWLIRSRAATLASAIVATRIDGFSDAGGLVSAVAGVSAEAEVFSVASGFPPNELNAIAISTKIAKVAPHPSCGEPPALFSSAPQKRHFLASSWIASAQIGHFFIFGPSPRADGAHSSHVMQVTAGRFAFGRSVATVRG
jgi:hypothetical protein